MRLHYLKTIGKLVAIAAMFFTDPFSLKGQMIGWPASTVSTTLTSGEYFMDATRAKASAISTSGSFPITLTNYVGTFSAGDWILIIQMEGSNNGIHEMKQIGWITGTSLNVLNFSTGFAHTYTIGDKVQVVKIPIYDVLHLSLGTEVTCNPYNSTTGTGGVLCFITNQIDFSTGGYFNVSAKGYDFSPTLGIGGAGTLAPSFSGGVGGGMPKLTAYPVYCPPITAVLGTGATDGDIGLSNGANGTNTVGTPPVFGNALLSGKITMGDCGIPGVKGGKGGGGGGFGGNGGFSNSVCGGTSIIPAGLTGQNGENGGKAGNGGKGAGLMLIKIHYQVTGVTYGSGVANNVPRFIADGEDGAPGLCPNIGGNGGMGGIGTSGCCNVSTNYANGNYGGYGKPGQGASGGDGGQGGEYGTIWIKCKMGVPYGLLANNFSVNSGDAGGGGLGANAYSRNHSNTGTWGFCTSPTACPIPPTPPTHYCDCDKAFQYLSYRTNGAGSATGYSFTGGSGLTSEYNNTVSNNITLISRDASGNFAHCNLYNKTICDQIFNKMANSVTIYPLGEPLSLNTSVTIHTLGDNTWKSDPSNIDVLNYKGTNQYLIDYSDPARQKCYTAPCFISTETQIEPTLRGTDGNTYEKPANGNIDMSGSNAGANATVEAPAPVPPLDLNSTTSGILGAKIYPVPVNQELMMDWGADGDASITITDISGKVLITKYCSSDCSNMARFNLNNLCSGVYMVNITINKSTQTLKFQKL